MHFLSRYGDYALAILRISLGSIFAFFGILAILDPVMQMSVWFSPWVQALPIVGTSQFVFALGVLEVLVGAALILGVGVRYAALAAAGMLVGIIVNIGFGEIAFRDLVILAGALVVATRHEYRFALKPEL